MSAFTFEARTVYTSCTCSECGITFCMPDWYVTRRQEDHKVFYCPNGHHQYYYQESEAEKLRKQLNEANSRLVHRQQTIDSLTNETDRLGRSVSSLRGHIKRAKNKAAAGVCPVDGCKRHFTNLQRHIQSKHPSWKAEKTE